MLNVNSKLNRLKLNIISPHSILILVPVNNNNGRQSDKQEHPEPEEDVDLLVEDVEGEDAKGVVLLEVARAPELVESALCQPGIENTLKIYISATILNNVKLKPPLYISIIFIREQSRSDSSSLPLSLRPSQLQRSSALRLFCQVPSGILDLFCRPSINVNLGKIQCLPGENIVFTWEKYSV